SIPPQSVALLAVLFLRGTQTAGELRINSERMHKFGDLLSVDAFLRELAERKEGGLVRELAKQAGARETRWAHLLSGEVSITAPDAGTVSGEGAVSVSELTAMKASIDQLSRDLVDLRETVARLRSKLGDDS
ncbi:MAG TPA: DUF480 domain-containing protein, partial [Usitatibacter sp.]